MADEAYVLDGAREGDSAAEPVAGELLRRLGDAGWRAEAVRLREVEIAPCIGCFGCWTKTPGRCFRDDGAAEVARRAIRSGLLVYVTSVTFGGYASPLKKALDRMICLVSPFFQVVDGEVHHRPRYPRYPRLLGVGVAEGEDGERDRVFETLVHRNAINLHAQRWAAGVVRSDAPEDRRRVRLDELVRRVGGPP